MTMLIEGVDIPELVEAKDVFRKYVSGEAWSDIQDHLPRLYNESYGDILEIGVRSGISTSAFLTGTARHGGRVFGIDIENCSNLFTDSHWTFQQGDSRTIVLDERFPSKFDVVFIDANHDYDYVLSDLNRFGLLAPKIILHDYSFESVRAAVNDFLLLKGKNYNLAAYDGSYGLAILTKRL